MNVPLDPVAWFRGGSKRQRNDPGLMVDDEDGRDNLRLNRSPREVDPDFIHSSCQVVMTRSLCEKYNGKLYSQFSRPLHNVVGYKVENITLPTPLFVGDVNPFYILTSNLGSVAFNGGRLGVNNLDILAIVPNIATSHTEGTTGGDQEWVKFGSRRSIECLEVALLDQNGLEIQTTLTKNWAVVIKFLYVIDVTRC